MLLARMVTARYRLATPRDPDVSRKAIEKVHGVGQEMVTPRI